MTGMVVSTKVGGPPGMAETSSPSGLALIAGIPRQLLDNARQGVRTSPGRLAGMLTGLVVLSLLTGLVGALMVQAKQDSLDQVAQHREPVLSASHQLFRALADADAATVSSFLGAGQDQATLHTRYQADIKRAGQALAVAAADFTGDDTNSKKISQIMIGLPVYTGLIEQAYANQRQGFPVSTSYLHEAYLLMQEQLLVPASDLYVAEDQRLAEEQGNAGGFPWWTTVFILSLLGALGYVQLYLRKRTNRLFNVGLSVATVAVLLSLIWGAAALITSAVYVSASQSDGSEPSSELQRSELLAITARAAETLTLVNRNPGVDYESKFQELRQAMIGDDGNSGDLGRARSLLVGSAGEADVDAATKDMRAWVSTHQKLRDLIASGESDQAVRLAVASDPASTGSLFNKLDAELLHAIDLTRTQFAKKTSAAANSLIGLQAGLIVFAVVAALGSTVGISKRLQEYR